MPPLYYSSNFLGDNIFAGAVALHFFCCALLSKHIGANLEAYQAVRFIRWLATHTFSLYVYHMPLLYFIRAVGRYDPHSLPAALTAMCVALLIIAGLSKITEERYPVLRKSLRQWLGTFAGRTRVNAPAAGFAPSADKII